MSRYRVHCDHAPSVKERFWENAFFCSLVISLLLLGPFFFSKSLFQGDMEQFLILLFFLLTAAWAFTAVSFVRFRFLRGKRKAEGRSDRRYRQAVGDGFFMFTLWVILGLLFCLASVLFFGFLLEEIFFPSTPLSGVYREAMRDYFRKEITAWSFVFLIFGLLFWLIIHFARRKLLSRWTYLILLLAVPILFFAGKDVGEISADLRNESYVVYNGAYRQWSTGGRRTNYYTALQDGDGEITLHSPSKLTQNGTFFGYVVYGEHTKYVVYVGKSFPKDP